MVRTYKSGYQLVSPWEQAMRNADVNEGRLLYTGKKTYRDVNVSQTTYDFNPSKKDNKLPPISGNREQMLHFHADEVGAVLGRGKGKIKTIKKELILYDPLKTGKVTKSVACEILHRYKIPPNENFQKQLVACFVDQSQPNKINQEALVEYLENCRHAALEEIASVKSERHQTSEYKLSDQTTGRYDSSSTPLGQEYEPRKAEAVQQAFNDRRDAALIIQIERAFRTCGMDPHDLIDQLEDLLQRTCRNDENLVVNTHLKGLVDKQHLPMNSALIYKCIERLDPYDKGQVEWPLYIDFLRRAVSNPKHSTLHIPSNQSNRSSRLSSRSSTLESVPEKPLWESRQPLQSITRQSNTSEDTKHTSNGSHDNEHTSNGYHDNEHTSNDYNADDNNFNNNDSSYRSNNSSRSYNEKWNELDLQESYNHHTHQNRQENDIGRKNKYTDYSNNYDSYDDALFPEVEKEENLKMDDDIEAAFIETRKKLDENRQKVAEDSNTNTDKNNNPYMEQNMSKKTDAEESNFSRMGERGEWYTKVSDALKDNAKYSQGRISTSDVRKICNYYNLLFDADIPLDQLNQVLIKYSMNDMVNVKDVIKSFGIDVI